MKNVQLCFIARPLLDKTIAYYIIHLEVRTEDDQDHKKSFPNTESWNEGESGAGLQVKWAQ